MRAPASLLFVSLILGGVWLSDATGRGWIASPDGSSGDGTLVEIIDQAIDGDEIRLQVGIHDWPASGLVGLSLSIQGDLGAVIRGDAVGAREVDWFEFIGIDFGQTGQVAVIDTQRFLFKNCEYKARPVRLLVSRADTLRIEGCRILENDQGEANAVPGVSATSCRHIIVENCEFKGNKSMVGGPNNQGGRGGGGLSIWSCETAVIRGNVFRENVALAGAALYFFGKTILLENNTFFENDCETAAVVLSLYGEKNDGIVRQNIFANNSAYGLWLSLDMVRNPRVYCNAFWGNQDIYDLCSREEGQWWACSALGYAGSNDHYSMITDPMFCGDGSLVVMDSSPLAHPPGSPCDPIGGALGFGDCANPVEATSWGAVKHLFAPEEVHETGQSEGATR